MRHRRRESRTHRNRRAKNRTAKRSGRKGRRRRRSTKGGKRGTGGKIAGKIQKQMRKRGQNEPKEIQTPKARNQRARAGYSAERPKTRA